MPDDFLSSYAGMRAKMTGQPAPGIRVEPDPLPFRVRPASLRDPASIPPRQWIYGKILAKGVITVTVAPGGVGKTSWAFGVGCSIARGRGTIGDWVHVRSPVIYCNLEDPEDEFDRRIAAFCLHHGVNIDRELRGWVHAAHGRERRLVLASLDVDGVTIVYPDKQAVIEEVRRTGAGLIVVDPFVNSHELEENSNPHINAAARAWAEIANEAGCAVLLIHHTRKGAVAGDIESARGAVALTSAARAAFTLTAMTPDEASGFGIPEGQRRRYVRLDEGRASIAPPSEKARWFELANVNLGNGTPEYPEGDDVQALAAWEPPALLKDLSPQDCNAVLDLIAEGPGRGQQFTASKAGGAVDAGRWAGCVLMRQHGMTEEQATKVIKAWTSNRLLETDTYKDPIQRKSLSCVVVNDAKRPTL
ncbi:helicase RepA family protein [Muricoccus nepalensis]|nr:helicase RepA family protein [Roseomonas nepalensis]